jgi:ATP-dependent DNA helicase DinG
VTDVGSPFDYATNARLYIPAGFPKPNEPTHAAAVATMASRCARALGGRTFVLTTTLRALQAIGERLRAEFEANGDSLRVLQQGEAPKRQLMQQFLATALGAGGLQSFWEGIDVPMTRCSARSRCRSAAERSAGRPASSA